MNKKKGAPKHSEAGQSIIRGMKEAIAWSSGEAVEAKQHTLHVPDVDVRELRERLNLTQSAFAEKYGFPLATVRNWEQNRREPELSARILLAVIARNPQIVEEVLSS